MKKMDDAMNSCAICGSAGELLKDGDFYTARCSNPDCSQRDCGIFDTEDAARDHWNVTNLLSLLVDIVPKEEPEG